MTLAGHGAFLGLDERFVVLQHHTVAERLFDSGQRHVLAYYDGPLLQAQMCCATGGNPVVEVIIDQRAAETDGTAVYMRLEKSDLQAMLRMLEEPNVVLRDMTLENPIRAIREISHDITCRRRVRLANGRELSAVEMQAEVMTSLRDEVTGLRQRLANLESHADTIEDIVRSLGGTVPPRPREINT